METVNTELKLIPTLVLRLVFIVEFTMLHIAIKVQPGRLEVGSHKFCILP